METAITELRARLREINDVEAAAALLEWDQSTYMPDGGAEARGRQLATLSRIAHGLKVAAETRALLDRASRETESVAEDHVDRALVRVARRDIDRAARVPLELVSELKTHLAASYNAWTKARPAGDFRTMRPFLEKTVELSRRYGEIFSENAHTADALIDEMDPGMTTTQVRALFAELRSELVPIVKTLTSAPVPDDAFLSRGYAKDAQLAFGREVVTRIGYDWSRGRQDLTHHPFMTKFSINDVRITTRVNEADFTDSFFGTIHECGHALYEQNLDPAFEGTPLGRGVSAGVHESQSRLWENVVARSRGFWECFLPRAKEAFPTQLADVDLDAFHRAVNKVEPSLVRVDADEVTYNLHVMIRFDLAIDMMEGKLAVKDLPEAWNARYQSDLGVTPPNDRLGCLQDVHWYVEKVGGLFQGYTIGNVTSAQLYEAAVRARPEIPARIAEGDFAPLRGWLAENVHRHGSVYEPNALIERATGAPLGIAPFVRYLKSKFGELYGVRFA